ncbi:MAG: 4-(cytidine 5'-diphospho)-2-C-methyl-D-erythritol kinase [Alphaproteobacteria bacterium]
MAIAETAYAKVNLYLHITGIRDDGYHELDSLFAFLELGDRLVFSPAPDLSLKAKGPFGSDVPETGDNLVLRAARALQQATDCSSGAEIVLDKRLPVASGIGGGSADAAATLRGLNKLWHLGQSDTTLEHIGATIGADVPACVSSRMAYISGIGETLQPASERHSAWLVLVNPGVSLSTPLVFQRFDETYSALHQPEGLVPQDRLDSWIAALHARENVLQPAACEKAPVIDRVIRALSATAGCSFARMSGSGATCFGVFADSSTAADAAAHLSRDHPDWWVACSKLRTSELEDAE